MRIFLIIVATLFGIAAGGIAVLARSDLETPIEPPTLVVIATWLSWGAITIIALVVLFAIVRGVWKRIGSVFGDSVAARFLSFGVVALVFSDTVSDVIYPFARFIVNLTMWAPATLAKIPPAKIDIDTGEYYRAVPEGLESLSRVIAVNFEAFGRDLLEINYAWLFVAAAAWAVIGQVFSSLMRTTPGGEAESPWSLVAQRLRSAPAAMWQNVLLLGVIAIGGLLSVSALITLPLLAQSNPLSTEEFKRIESEFDTIVKIEDKSPLSSQDLLLSDKLRTDLNDLATQIANERERRKPASATEQKTAPATEQELERLRRIDEQRASIVRESQSFWSDYQPSIRRNLDSVKAAAVLAVRRQNYAPGGAGSAYVADVSYWLSDSVSAVKSSADYCRRELLDSIAKSIVLAKRQLDSLDSPGVPDDVGYEKFYYCNLETRYRDQPKEPRLTLGAFGFSAWLINLNSLPLTLIAGMLGFGLVGAAVSSVLRERKERDAGKPLVSDISSILVRGLSATIVVYLAVKGGLVIFTAGSAGQPDPHVLLLTCLIASVFSEDVWATARERFLRKANETQGEAKETEGTVADTVQGQSESAGPDKSQVTHDPASGGPATT